MINALIAFDKNVEAEILCPECRQAYLKILDCDLSKADPAAGFERWMFCEKCGARNVGLYRNRSRR